MRHFFNRPNIPQVLFLFLTPLTLFLIGTGCGGVAGLGGGSTSQGNGGPALLDSPLSFQGSISGKLVDSQSTRTSNDGTAAGQTVPPTFDTDNTSVRFMDLAGNDLLDPSGQPISSVPVASDGSFTADALPVGVDFTVCGDIGRDGTCEMESIIGIPSEDGGPRGRLDGIQADPLTTAALAKFRRIIRTLNTDVRDLPVSPASVVTRIVDAYTHLFDETGIDQKITLSDIAGLTPEQLADLFDQVVPPTARSGMEVAQSTVALAQVDNLDTVVLRVAEVFLRAGFPIADRPGPPDLSALANLDGIDQVTKEELFPNNNPFDELDSIPADLLDQFPDLMPPDLAGPTPDGMGDLSIDGLSTGFLDQLAGVVNGQMEPGTTQTVGADGVALDVVVFYVNRLAEPDRNFALDLMDPSFDGPGLPPLPVLSDRLLMQMARLQQAGRRITLAALHDLLTSLDDGLGVRLTFEINDPNFFGPPLTVFQTADGRGKAINLDRLFLRFFQAGLNNLDSQSFDRQEGELRSLLRELLGSTSAPTFARLFGAIISDRINGIDDLARQIREARAHIPFSRSGPSSFFVVADGDPFRDGAVASPVTVDAEVTNEGVVQSVTFNASGNGAFYLGFTEQTNDNGLVELLVRQTGRPLHGRGGPVRVRLDNADIFQPINGVAFIDFVSERGSFFPGTNIAVIREDFTPEPMIDLHPMDNSGFIEPPLDEGMPPDSGIPPDLGIPPDSGIEDPALAAAASGVTPIDNPSSSPLGDFRDAGPNKQLFVLATGLGPNAEPVRVDFDRSTNTATFNPGGRNLLMFLPDSQETGLFALFNEDTGRPARAVDPTDFFQAPPERPENLVDAFNAVDNFNQPDQLTDFGDLFGGLLDELMTNGDAPPPGDIPPGDMPPGDTTNNGAAQFLPVEPLDPMTGGTPGDVGFPEPGFILVAAADVVGLPIDRVSFTHVFGIEVPNEQYDASGDPFFDDINGNGIQDPDEPTAQFRPTLFDPADWRSTDIRLYYRRADQNGSVAFEQVDFDSPTPQTLDGVALVPRNYIARLNAFRFGRPNTAINLLTAFAPPEFFDGTHALNRDTQVDIFSAIAIINLVMDQVVNIEADIDPDGIGPLPRKQRLVTAHLFVAPINDPFELLIRGFRNRSQ